MKAMQTMRFFQNPYNDGQWCQVSSEHNTHTCDAQRELKMGNGFYPLNTARNVCRPLFDAVSLSLFPAFIELTLSSKLVGNPVLHPCYLPLHFSEVCVPAHHVYNANGMHLMKHPNTTNHLVGSLVKRWGDHSIDNVYTRLFELNPHIPSLPRQDKKG